MLRDSRGFGKLTCIRAYSGLHVCVCVCFLNSNLRLLLTRMTTVLSDKNLGKCIGAGAGNEGLGRVEGHVMNGLIVLLPVSCDLLHARPVVQHPQAHRAVVACRGQREGAHKDNMKGKDNCRDLFFLF